MPNTIHIPTPLRPFTDKQESVEVSGGTVGELLADLTKKYDGLRKHLYTDEGKLRNFVNVYLNDEDIRNLQKQSTPLSPGDTLSIVPSVAGGSPAVETPADLPTLTSNEIARYSRHLILPEVGMDGQVKLKQAKVLADPLPVAGVCTAVPRVPAPRAGITIPHGPHSRLAVNLMRTAHAPGGGNPEWMCAGWLGRESGRRAAGPIPWPEDSNQLRGGR